MRQKNDVQSWALKKHSQMAWAISFRVYAWRCEVVRSCASRLTVLNAEWPSRKKDPPIWWRTRKRTWETHWTLVNQRMNRRFFRHTKRFQTGANKKKRIRRYLHETSKKESEWLSLFFSDSANRNDDKVYKRVRERINLYRIERCRLL